MEGRLYCEHTPILSMEKVKLYLLENWLFPFFCNFFKKLKKVSKKSRTFVSFVELIKVRNVKGGETS